MVDYFAKLRTLPSFKQFAHEDDLIWDSGEYPKFVPQWWGRCIPWWVVVAVGNWRAFGFQLKPLLGLFHCERRENRVSSSDDDDDDNDDNNSGEGGVPKYFERINQSMISDDLIKKTLNFSKSIPLAIIPDTRGFSSCDACLFPFSQDETVFFLSPSLPLSVATQMCIYQLLQRHRHMTNADDFQVRMQAVDTLLLTNQSPEYLRLMPFGEVPLLVHRGPFIIYLLLVFFFKCPI